MEGAGRTGLFVVGVMPNYVKEDKFAILVEAGMNRVRMGIQNGSWDILQFYERPTPPERILEAAAVIAKFKGYMIPPNYEGQLTTCALWISPTSLAGVA